MVDALSSFITEARKYKFSVISSLLENDIVTIWESVSEFVKKQMLQHKGVMIPGLGMFTFSQKKIDVGSNKFIVIQRPVFVLSEKFVQTHSLRYPKQHTSGQIPIVPLNFTVLSNVTSFDRSTVELCIKEIIQTMSRLLAANRHIQFDFCHIGRLLICDCKVKMRFYREFIAALDSSGDLEYAFRPDTAHSVLSIMTNPSTPRSGTATKLVLPKIVEPKGVDALNLECTSSPPLDTPKLERKSKDSSLDTSKEEKDLVVGESENPDGNGDSSIAANLESGKLTPLTDRTLSDSHQLVPKPAILFDVGELHKSLSLKPKSVHSSRGSARKHVTTEVEPVLSSRPSTCSHLSSAGQDLCYLCHQRALKNVFIDLSEEKKKREIEQDKLLQAHQQRKDLVAQVKEKIQLENKKLHNREIASFNNGAAQRTKAKREIKTSEYPESYVFQDRGLTPPEYLKQNDYCSQLDDQVKHNRRQLKEMKDLEERLEREEQKELAEELAAYQESYIKEKIAKMEQHRQALAEQIAIKHEISSMLSNILDPLSNTSYNTNSHSSSSNNSTTTVAIARTPAVLTPHLSGRLRPLSLPKPTIVLPFSHTKTMNVVKDGSMKMVRMKPTTLVPLDSKAASHQPVFGVQDASTEKLKEQKKKARELFLEQLKNVADKQEKMRLKAFLAQKEEADMLQQTRKGLISDLRSEKLSELETRKSLEKSWNATTLEKQRRLSNELKHTQEPSILLHQQCEKYHRCKQCQRRSENHGQSNLLYESRYISGSRLMV